MIIMVKLLQLPNYAHPLSVIMRIVNALRRKKKMKMAF